MNDLIRIGRLNKAFGLKGHLRAFIEPQLLVRIRKPKFFFLMQKNLPLPYFIAESDFTESGHGMILFKEVNDRTAADLLVGKEIFLEKKSLKKEKPFASLRGYIGFEIMDEKHGMLGTLTDVIQLPQHELGQLFFQEKEILFPLNEHVVQKTDTKKKILYVSLPEGLLDVFLKT